MRRICIICGMPEDEHHEPQWRQQPDACCCDPLEWSVEIIPPPCGGYVGNGVKSCERCEHDPECHSI